MLTEPKKVAARPCIETHPLILCSVLKDHEDARRKCDGRSILEMLEHELDVVVERLMAQQETEDGQDKGRAEAMAYALAIFRQPYNPDYPGEKNRAMERWHAANEEEE